MPLIDTFELILPGPPVSAQNQTGSRPAWEAEVAAEALQKLGGAPDVNPAPLCLSASNYFDGGIVEPDIDNMLKPIQDALINVLYADDRHLFDSLGTKRRLGDDIEFEGPISAALRDAFDVGDEFVHVQLSTLEARHFRGL